MKIRQIRNATMRIEFGEKCFLTDPWLQDVGTIPPFGSVHRIPNPTVPLPMKILDILKKELRQLACCKPFTFN